jgi:hypothetical protein
MKKLLVLVIVMVTLLTGCINEPSPKGLMPIGSKMNILQIQHLIGTQYDVEVEVNNKPFWILIGDYQENDPIVFDDVEVPYLIRLNDSHPSDLVTNSSIAMYEIHKKKSLDVDAGEVNMGTTKTPRKIQTQMVK